MTTVHTVAERFIDLCNQGKNFDVMRTLYTPDIVSVEAGGVETKGQQAVIKKSEDWVVLNTIESQAIRGPFFNNRTDTEGQFAVIFVHEVTPKATGTRVALEEIGVYTVSNGLITHEKFYYEGGR